MTTQLYSSLLQEDIQPYERYDLHESWWTHFAPKMDILYKEKELFIHRKKILKGLSSLKEARIAGYNVAWDQDLTAERVQKLEELQKACGWDYFRINWKHSRAEAQRFDLLQQAGYDVFQTDFEQQYIANVSAGFESYLTTISKYGRRDFNKRLRLGQALNPQLRTISKPSEIEPFFAEFFASHIPYWAQKTGQSYFSNPAERGFIIDWSKKLYETGILRLDRLIMGGEVANLSMLILSGNYAYFWITINTGLHKEYVPGIVGLGLRMQELAKLGIQYCNLGAGDYPYKIWSANQVELCKGAFVFNPKSLKAQLCHKWLRAKAGSH